MPQKKMKKALKPKKKLLSPVDEDDAEVAAKEADAEDDETVDREPGIEEIAKIAVEVVAATDDDLDQLDLPTAFEPPESEN